MFFQQFRDIIIGPEKDIAVVCPNLELAHWARRMVREILGRPVSAQQYKLQYTDKVVRFLVISSPADEFKLRGLSSRIVYFDGNTIDSYFGIQR